MNILVTGANGQLGNEMRIVAKGSKDKYIFSDVCDEHPESVEMLHKLAGEDIDTSSTKLDITNLDGVREMVKVNDVKVIVNCAAWTNVDGAEDPEKYDIVELLNAKAPENLAIAMKEVNGLLVHISTDYVFGGDPYNTPCKEDQKGTPTGVYGLTKLHGEQNIQNAESAEMKHNQMEITTNIRDDKSRDIYKNIKVTREVEKRILAIKDARKDRGVKKVTFDSLVYEAILEFIENHQSEVE